MGERIGMDITNVIWDRVLYIINNNDYEGASCTSAPMNRAISLIKTPSVRAGC